MPGWDFDKIKDAADQTWNGELKKIEIKGGNIDDLTNFYTALYHTMVFRMLPVILMANTGDLIIKYMWQRILHAIRFFRCGILTGLPIPYTLL